MALRLYARRDCPFCWKVRLALSLLQQPYEFIELALGETHAGLEALTPAGRRSVPVLQDGALVIWDSAAILEYLAEGYDPQQRLLCEGVEVRARARLLSAYADQQIGPALRDVVFEKRSKPQADWDLDKIEQGTRLWRQRLDELESWLNGSDYFIGVQASLAECALLPRFALAQAYGVGVEARWSGLYRWYNRLLVQRWCRETFPLHLARPWLEGRPVEWDSAPWLPIA